MNTLWIPALRLRSGQACVSMVQTPSCRCTQATWKSLESIYFYYRLSANLSLNMKTADNWIVRKPYNEGCAPTGLDCLRHRHCPCGRHNLACRIQSIDLDLQLSCWAGSLIPQCSFNKNVLPIFTLPVRNIGNNNLWPVHRRKSLFNKWPTRWQRR